MKFALLLDSDHKKKYITPCFNMEFAKNLSYFYQYLTKTKFVHGLPYNVNSVKLEDSEIEQFEQYLTHILQTEFKYNEKTNNEKVSTIKLLHPSSHYHQIRKAEVHNLHM